MEPKKCNNKKSVKIIIFAFALFPIWPKNRQKKPFFYIHDEHSSGA